MEMHGVRRVGRNLPCSDQLVLEWAGIQFTLGFCKGINIFYPFTRIYHLIVSQIIDLMFVHPGLIDDPRCIRQDLVCPATMPHSFASFRMGHGRSGLVLRAEFV